MESIGRQRRGKLFSPAQFRRKIYHIFYRSRTPSELVALGRKQSRHRYSEAICAIFRVNLLFLATCLGVHFASLVASQPSRC